MIRILIVDDHPLVRRGVRQALEESPDFKVTAEAEDGVTALRQLETQAFDAVILDLTMPGMSGLETLEEIRARHPNLPVLILSMHAEEQYALRAFKLGASGFLSKDATPDIMVGALQKIIGGGKFVTPTLAEKLVFSLKSGKTQKHENLSNREYQIMKMIASGRTPKEISSDLSISVKTISTYRTRVLKKLHFRTTAELVKYCVENQLLDGTP